MNDLNLNDLNQWHCQTASEPSAVELHALRNDSQRLLLALETWNIHYFGQLMLVPLWHNWQ
jgi:hypothetical protein